MTDLKKALKSKLHGTVRVAVLGIGSELRGDDIAGVLVAQKVERAAKRSGIESALKGFCGGSSPESFTGEIIRFNPTHVVMVDCADFGGEPGSASLFEKDSIEEISFSTHRLPTRIIADYLIHSLSCEILIIGIQPFSMGVCEPATPVIKRTTSKISSAVIDAVKKSF